MQIKSKEPLPNEIINWTTQVFEKYKGVSQIPKMPERLSLQDYEFFKHAKGTNLNINQPRNHVWWKKICCRQVDETTLEEFILPSTLVRKGNWLYPKTDTRVYLLEQPYFIEFPENVKYPFGIMRLNVKSIFEGKPLRWVTNQCKVFKFATMSKNVECTRLFVDLFESNCPETLCCKSIISLLKNRQISIPLEFHCSSCSCLVVRAGSAR